MELEQTRKEIIDEFMSKIDPTWSDLEKARYIYVNLGRLYSFDLDYQYGNSKRTKEILSCAKRLSTKDENQLLNLMQNKYIICISLSKLYLELLQKSGITNVELMSVDDSNDPHMDVKMTCGSEQSYIFNLQGDLKNIQTGMKTKYFAQNQKVSGTTTISDEELRILDEKTGYISDERSYTDECIKTFKELPIFKHDESNKKKRKNKPDSILKKYLDEMNHRWKELIKTSANILKLGNERIET